MVVTAAETILFFSLFLWSHDACMQNNNNKERNKKKHFL